MKQIATIRRLAPVLAIGVISLIAVVYAAERRNDHPFQKVKLDADDLAEVTGLNVYKFQVNIPKGERFRILFREVMAENGNARELHQYSFRKDQDAETTIRLSFLRRDGKLEGVLLSDEKEALYRVDCPGCSPSGIATIVPLPLSDLELTKKTLFVHRSAKDNEQWGMKETRLITLVSSEPGKPAPPPTSYPRGELVIERAD